MIICRPTSRLLSFALCLEWIKGIYNNDCLECYRPHASVDTTTPGIDRKPKKHATARNTDTIYSVKIVNK